MTDHRWRAGWQAAAGGWVGVAGTEQRGKRTHGHGQQCDDCSGA